MSSPDPLLDQILPQASPGAIDRLAQMRQRLTRAGMGSFTPRHRTRATVPREEGSEPAPRISLYADGHHVSILLPREARAGATSQGIADLFVDLHLEVDAVEFARQRTCRSWVARLTDPRLARWMDGMNCGYGDSAWTVQCTLYRGAGARAFFCAVTSAPSVAVITAALQRRMIEIGRGHLHFRLILSSTAVMVWFSRPPEVSQVRFHVEQPSGRVLYTLIAAQLATAGCEVCQEDVTATPHGGFRCPSPCA